jgi:hypothetical protein
LVVEAYDLSRESPGQALEIASSYRHPVLLHEATDAGRADARIRTADPFITSEVLYQLSYVGGARLV